ncbi:PDZ domain-containing protein, partial [Candidatus Saccharibacteria bacterium]|nr:PDZ domain-containing protein [Candidatus Saccharibacteria bacterium]
MQQTHTHMQKDQTVDADKNIKSVSKNTFLASIALCLVIGFIAGTRNNELYATVAPLFGLRASSDTLDLRLVQTTYQTLKANYDGSFDDEALIDGAARGMTEAIGDPHTVFLSKTDAEDFAKQLNGEVSGVGSEIGVRGGQPTILRVLVESPAERAGLRAGDVIVSVNEQSVLGADSATVAGKIRGEVGTSVKIAVMRGLDRKEFTITRAIVTDDSVRYSI